MKCVSKSMSLRLKGEIIQTEIESGAFSQRLAWVVISAKMVL